MLSYFSSDVVHTVDRNLPNTPLVVIFRRKIETIPDVLLAYVR